eukprot:TRINITY_DN2090_c0_g1_i1.p1 TRINITY_DN2090_c0_g1~~TRINITY_DN2090_c0_g1_i1.p1  ORF type:complete len:467 (+),score=101.22 TRINITY_DN2090_c0_g1_i1:313-1713(+)
MNHYTYLVDVLVAALDRMGVRALGARPLLLTTQASSEDAALSFHLLQAFPMASVVEKGNELYSKLSDASGEAWKSADGLVALPGAAPTPQQLVAATRFATSFIALLVKDESVSSLFPLFNQTPMRRVCVGTGTGYSLLIASKRIVYAMDATAFVQLTPMDAQLWALSPEEWRASFVMRMQHALLPAYAAFAAAATPNVNVNVPFLPHPQSQFMPGPVSSSPMFFPGPAPLNPIFGTINAATNVASPAASGSAPNSAPAAPISSFPPNSQFSLPPMSSPMGPDRMQPNPAMLPPHLQHRGSFSVPNQSRRLSVVPSMLPMPELSEPIPPALADEPYGLDGLAAGALASIVKRGSQEESDSDNNGSGADSGSEPDNHNSLLFLKGSHAANQGRHLEGAIRKFKNQFSKKDVITRVCKMKYRSAQRKLRIAKYIEIWPEIATMSQRAAERYISQNLKKRVEVPATVGGE